MSWRGTYKAEKRGGREGRAGRSAREPEPGAASLAPAADAQHARRYNDMAPKHWEEGPPRYHGPTEYERPPPYYYPGPNIPRVSSAQLRGLSLRRRPGTSQCVDRRV
uniref:Uncharacterized protein n=1 Tax=Bombyx mori TaxID=7091 RepID=A0A8R2C629_BOMMO|nr:prominin-like protein [Bombyx mori]